MSKKIESYKPVPPSHVVPRGWAGLVKLQVKSYKFFPWGKLFPVVLRDSWGLLGICKEILPQRGSWARS